MIREKLARDPELAAAVRLHMAGRLNDAILSYRKLMDQRQNDPDVLHLCGLAAHQAGASAAGVTLIGAAISLRPDDGEFHNQHAMALMGTGARDKALLAFRRCVLLGPEAGVAALFNLAQMESSIGEDAAAERLLRQVLAARPNHAEAWTWLGAGHWRRGELEPAERMLRTALDLNDQLALAWSHLGNVLADRGRVDDATEAFAKAVSLAPGLVEAHANHGNLLRLNGRRAEARKVFEDAIAFNQGTALLWSGLSATAVEQDDIQLALDAARRAIELDPELPDGHANLGQALHRMGSCAEAVAATRQALELAPDNAALRLNLATHLLGNGELIEGWDAYEWRISGAHQPAARGLPPTRWREGPPPGRRLLITAEQGLGDEIEFATCLPDIERLRAAGALEAVVVECSTRLVPLFTRAFPNFSIEPRLLSRETAHQPVNYGEMVARHGVDCHLALGSLPGLLRRRIEDFAGSGGMFRPDPSRLSEFRRALNGFGAGRRVGICWRSLAGRDRADTLYSNLLDWRAVLALEGVVPVNLQYDRSEEEIAGYQVAGGLVIHSVPDLDLMNDLDGVATLISALDLVVTMDNTVFQLAGAMGTPALVMSTGYYWPSLGTGTSPWYRDVTLFTRGLEESWSELLTRVAVSVREWST